MSLLGTAVVAIWNDILPEGRHEFIEWHNREHIPERVAIPGFRRGRRYVAIYGTPEYFTLYEADDPDVLVGPHYLERLNNPTPWTRKATQAFRNTSRGVCRTLLSLGTGDGGSMITLRFDAAPGREDALREHIESQLRRVIAAPSLCGAHLCVADREASGLETAERKGREVGVPSWIVMLEGSDADGVEAAAETMRPDNLGRLGAAGAVERGHYRLEYSLANVR